MPQNITQHIAAIDAEGELDEAATCEPYLQVRTEGTRQIQRSLKHYSLPMILSVGYRVRSHRGTQFRKWATARLEEYLVKGFTLDDQRLKEAGGGTYFEELLARIRDIRSSEKVFWRKVLDIYATSIDYDPRQEMSQRFFQTVQNKMHWAAHGRTAAEVIIARADADKPNMGLLSWSGDAVRKTDVAIVKNYRNPEELDARRNTPASPRPATPCLPRSIGTSMRPSRRPSRSRRLDRKSDFAIERCPKKVRSGVSWITVKRFSTVVVELLHE